jgi:ATP/maltotriose-dependent transcriptional regulator MalT
LLTRLGRAAEGKVAIISAAAGSGKSPPLRAWAGRVSRPDRLALVQVNRDQRDVRDFWLALPDAVLATRRDLPLHLHQLRLAGELAEIRAAERRSAPTYSVARKLETTTHDNREKENYVCPRQRGYSRCNG